MCILFLLTLWKTFFKDAVFYIMVDPSNRLYNFIVFLLLSIVGFQFSMIGQGSKPLFMSFGDTSVYF